MVLYYKPTWSCKTTLAPTYSLLVWIPDPYTYTTYSIPNGHSMKAPKLAVYSITRLGGFASMIFLSELHWAGLWAYLQNCTYLDPTTPFFMMCLWSPYAISLSCVRDCTSVKNCEVFKGNLRSSLNSTGISSLFNGDLTTDRLRSNILKTVVLSYSVLKNNGISQLHLHVDESLQIEVKDCSGDRRDGSFDLGDYSRPTYNWGGLSSLNDIFCRVIFLILIRAQRWIGFSDLVGISFWGTGLSYFYIMLFCGCLWLNK